LACFNLFNTSLHKYDNRTDWFPRCKMESIEGTRQGVKIFKRVQGAKERNEVARVRSYEDAKVTLTHPSPIEGEGP